MTILSTTWKAMLANNPVLEDILEKLDNFYKPFLPENAADIVAAAYLEEDVPLIAYNGISKEVTYFHHLRKFGGRRFGPSASWAILSGLKSSATACEIRIEDFFENLPADTQVPSNAKIWSLDTTDKIKACTPASLAPPAAAATTTRRGSNAAPADTNHETQLFRGTMVIPPHLIEVLAENHSQQPIDLLVTTVVHSLEYDEDHEDQDGMATRPTAQACCAQFAQFLALGNALQPDPRNYLCAVGLPRHQEMV